MAPQTPKVTHVDTSEISIEWSPPSYDGGSPISHYIVQKRDRKYNTWSKLVSGSTKDTAYVFRGMRKGVSYEFRVAAVNKIGQGSFSKPSQPTACQSLEDSGRFSIKRILFHVRLNFVPSYKYFFKVKTFKVGKNKFVSGRWSENLKRNELCIVLFRFCFIFRAEVRR